MPTSTTGKQQWEATAKEIAASKNIPADLFSALIETESGWNAFAVGSKGEIGLTQLMPATAQMLKVQAFNPRENLIGGATYLAMQFEKFGDWRKALAAYNAGPNNIEAGYAYADKILQRAGMTQSAEDAGMEEPSIWKDIWDWYKRPFDKSDTSTDTLGERVTDRVVESFISKYGVLIAILVIATVLIALGSFSLVKTGTGNA